MNEFLVEQRDNFFPEADILHPLTRFILDNTQRKLVYNLNSWRDVPKVMREAVEFSRDEMSTTYNHAIIKKYKPDDLSQAFERHVDPKSVSGAPLFLCNLSGTADFTVWETMEESEREHVFKCIPNRLTIANEHLDHKVSRPTNPDGIRSLLFLGVTQ